MVKIEFERVGPSVPGHHLSVLDTDEELPFVVIRMEAEPKELSPHSIAKVRYPAWCNEDVKNRYESFIDHYLDYPEQVELI